MAYKKQLRDKDGNVVYPDVGLNLDDVVYSDDPTEEITPPTAWVESGDIDFSTFAVGNTSPTTLSGTTSSVGTSWKNLSGSYTTPHTGAYFITAVVSGGAAGTTAFQTNMRVRKGTTDLITEDVWSIANYAGNNFTKIVKSGLFWIAKGQVLQTSAKNTNWTGSVSHWTTIQPLFWLND